MISDHDQIKYLIAVYSFYVDYREFDKLGELLADASFALSWPAEGIETGEITGREEIERYYAEHLEERRPSRHVITNIAIDLDESGDSADVFSYITSIGHPPEPPSVQLSGHYEDRFVKVDGKWRFARKYCVMELPS